MEHRVIKCSVIADRAQSYLDNVAAWRRSHDPADHDFLENALADAHKAEALIALLEVGLCGHAGGHAPGQGLQDRATKQERLRWVTRAMKI